MIGKHATEEKRAIALAGTILRCQVGSGVHGTSVGGQDDRDEMGICVEPPEYVIGLRNFEQYEYHTAWEREGGLRERSGPGDLDEVVYSLRKWLRLALSGNPTVLLPLFVPESEITEVTYLGRELRDLAPAIVSRQAGYRFAGYLQAQRRGLLSHQGRGRDVTRPELVEMYGFDTKYAGHMIRLGIQGIELLSTGRLILPMKAADAQCIREIRTGKHTMESVLTEAERLEDQLRILTETSKLPEYPDRDAADPWLVSAYQRAWAAAGR
jgi:predicted nucleotidyltransferase